MTINEITAHLQKLGFRELPSGIIYRPGLRPETTEYATLREIGRNDWVFDARTEEDNHGQH